MGHNSHASTFFLIALIMFAATMPLAHAQLGGLIGGLLGGITGTIGGVISLLGALIPGLLPVGTIVPISSVPPPVLNNVLPLLVQGLTVNGTLCCTPTGNCPGQPLVGALVSLNCTRNQFAGGSLVIGQGVTDVTGYFNITVLNILSIIPNIIPLVPCNITVQLPLDQAICPALSTVDGTLGTVNQILTAVVTIIGIALNQLVGLVVNAGIGVVVRA